MIHCLCTHWLNFAPSKATHADFCVFPALLLSLVWIVLVFIFTACLAVLWIGRLVVALSSKVALVY